MAEDLINPPLKCPKCKAMIEIINVMGLEGAKLIGTKYKVKCNCGHVFMTALRKPPLVGEIHKNKDRVGKAS